MAETFTVAAIQLNSAREIAPNLQVIGELVREAAAKGATLIGLPENCAMMEPVAPLLRAKAAPEETHPALSALRALAGETGVWLLAGSLHIALPPEADGRQRVANRSFLIGPQGQVEARYDKIHMFDVDLDNGESYRESATFRPGEKAVTVDLPQIRLGMSICYDVRFAYLYRRLAQSGAGLLSVPAAFTRTTGRAHWHVLLRARAIETGSYVFAPAQCGTHAEGRETFGHALIVDPWGEVLADAGADQPGLAIATIDPAAVAAARRKIPALTHDRDFSLA